MALEYFLRNGLQSQIDIIHSVAKALIKPPRVNSVGQIVSLLNILRTVSRKTTLSKEENTMKGGEALKTSENPPIESVRGIGKKLGAKLRFVGIMTIKDLKKINLMTFKVPGITGNRLQKWQNSLK